MAPVGPGSLNLLTGNFTVTRTDVSIPGFGSALEFARSSSSRGPTNGAKTAVLGPGWTPTVPVEAAGAEWQKATEVAVSAEEKEEGLEDYVLLTDLEGYEYAFEKFEGGYTTPPELSGFVLSKSGNQFTLADPGGNRTIFEQKTEAPEYVPVSVIQTGGSGNKTQMVYELVGGKARLKMAIAPSGSGITCTESGAKTTAGCRVLSFSYLPATTWGGSSSFGDRLAAITYYGPSSATANSQWEVAKYEYNSLGQLVKEWDPRISPALKESYAYRGFVEGTQGQLQTITPPGEEPWTLEYGALPGEPASTGRLMRVKRPSLLANPSVAQTTIAYGVPLSGKGAPYGMSASAVAQWGQQDVPTDATAIFPPDQIPNDPPATYARATIDYMDAEGQLVNTATPSGAGTSAPSITTTEADKYGNVVRELSAQNRMRALAAEDPVARSHELETKRTFAEEGTEMRDELGPLHEVRLESGESVQARAHTVVSYDEGWTQFLASPKPHLPTRETTGAAIAGKEVDADQRLTETKYNWGLRKPIETIVDPQGLNIRSHVTYEAFTGLPTERSQPSNPEGGGAGTTKTVYYTSSFNFEDNACGSKPGWAGLPCKVIPAAQPGGSLPNLLTKRVETYNALGEPTKVLESSGESQRETLTTYDAAGRVTSTRQVGGGTAIPPTETVYSETTGRPTTQKFTCEKECGGFDSQALRTSYDALGRPTTYEDADGNKSSITYDLLGRPVTSSDGKGIQTRTYDPTSGMLVRLEDSAAGTFTASYDADGNIVEKGLPDSLVAKTTYDETGAPSHLSYTKVSGCSIECTWLDFGAERSITGQILAQTSLSSSQQYSYDKAGRLTLVKDTPQGGFCTTRTYSYDADSNRTALITRTPEIGSACDTSSKGITQSYGYDAADRLNSSGVTYDNFGRITILPGSFAGGGTLTTSYFSNDMIASQSQGAITNSYQLDSTGRVRQVTQTGSKEGTEVFHYAMASDSAAWTERGSTWTRNIAGIGGLGAIQSSTGETSLQLTNMHGDVVATASLSPTATKPTATFEFDEFGNPKSGTAGRFGWLGGKQRRTELPSGVIQMGVRSYIPALGRFLNPDPVPGGSANAYDYANQDPVNNFDLTGEKVCIWVDGGEVCANTGKGLRRRAQYKRRVDRQRIEHAARNANRTGHHYGGTELPKLPLGDHLAWSSCVPGEALGAKLKVVGACVPKVKLNVTVTESNVGAVDAAARIMGAAWCMAANGYGGSSPYSMAFSVAAASPGCVKNAWAYVHVPGGP